MTDKDSARAADEGRAYLEHVKELVAAWDAGNEVPQFEGVEEALDAIVGSALSVQVRSGWRSVGEGNDDPQEFNILIATGGPAARIVGGLNEHCEPETAKLQYQDWFLPWTDVPADEAEAAIILKFATAFYFGGV
jgi:hypothetical protein